MKFLIIYCVLFMSVSQAFSKPVSEECGLNKDFFQGCSDDCTGQTFCVDNHLIKINCKIQSGGEKLYCNSTSNLCQSAEVPCNNNPSKPNEFQCPGQDAFYPDPLDCTKYYQCKNKIPQFGYCYSGYKFNPKKSNCDKIAKCVQFSEKGECRHKFGKYVVHPLEHNVYVKCETYPIVMRCPTDHIFDSKIQECKYNCIKKGTYPDNNNEEYFYVCEKVGLRWQPKHMKCSDGMIYDRNFVGCVLKASSEESSHEETSPTESSPEETVPTESSPEEPSQTEASPEETLPTEASPEEPAPTEASPEEILPTETSPEEPAPTEASPEEPLPTDASLEESLPTDASPEEPLPTDASPEEPTPNETSPQFFSIRTFFK